MSWMQGPAIVYHMKRYRRNSLKSLHTGTRISITTAILEERLTDLSVCSFKTLLAVISSHMQI